MRAIVAAGKVHIAKGIRSSDVIHAGTDTPIMVAHCLYQTNSSKAIGGCDKALTVAFRCLADTSQ